jgi:hypothetical protein
MSYISLPKETQQACRIFFGIRDGLENFAPTLCSFGIEQPA